MACLTFVQPRSRHNKAEYGSFFAGCYLTYNIVRGACEGKMNVAYKIGIYIESPFCSYIDSMAGGHIKYERTSRLVFCLRFTC